MTVLGMVPLFIGTTELLLIGGIALLLFGGKKLPKMMKGLGQGVKSFKQGMNEADKVDDSPAEVADTTATQSDSPEKPAEPNHDGVR